jgi:hypothetical protein
MMAKFMLLLVLYGGLSIAALLLVLIGVALARTRVEVVGTALVAGVLVLVHVAELVYLADMGRRWSGSSDGIDPLVLAGSALALIAGAAVVAFLRRKPPPESFSGGKG